MDRVALIEQAVELDAVAHVLPGELSGSGVEGRVGGHEPAGCAREVRLQAAPFGVEGEWHLRLRIGAVAEARQLLPASVFIPGGVVHTISM
ncbi:hypothetical protein D3C72_2320030 [compost metagenome]